MMSEEPAPEAEVPAPVEAAAEPVAPPPAEPEAKGFDWTQYSLTIAIFTVFVIVKTLSALGIYNPSGN